jgi:hypothetical protein
MYVSTLEFAGKGPKGSPVKCTLQSAGRSLKKKMHRAARVQISTSESGPKYICGQRSKMAFMAKQAAATLLLLKYKYGRSFLLAYIEKMAACRFTRSFVWHSSAQNIYAEQIKSRR